MVKDVYGDGVGYMSEELFKKVYAIGDELGNVKIGISGNIDKRLGQLKTSNPVKLSVLHKSQSLSNAIDVEAMLHEKFSQYKVSGEWFRLPQDEFDTIGATIDEFVYSFGERHIGEDKKANDRIASVIKQVSGRSAFGKQDDSDEKIIINALLISSPASIMSSDSIVDVAVATAHINALRDMTADDFGDKDTFFADIISSDLYRQTVDEIRSISDSGNFYDAFPDFVYREFMERANIFLMLDGFRFSTDTIVKIYNDILPMSGEFDNSVCGEEINLLRDFIEDKKPNGSECVAMVCNEVYGLSVDDICKVVSPPKGTYYVKPSISKAIDNEISSVVELVIRLALNGVSLDNIKVIIERLFSKKLWDSNKK